MSIEVRTAKEEEYEEANKVSELAFQNLRQIYRPNEKAIKNHNTIQSSLSRLIAILDEKIVGTVKYRIDKQSLHIIGLATHPNYIKQGIAKSIITELKNIAVRHNLNKLSLFTIKQTGNVEIFTKLGFKIISEEIATDLCSDKYNKLIDVRMEKEI